MEVDIDIEEHDILENPHVRNMLPSIDHIKEEPMDYEDNYEEYSSQNYEAEEDIEDSFNNELSDSESDAAPLGFTNRIVLGSKPNTANLKYLHVLLEDWGPHLERNACFCGECKTLFATRNALDAHNMIAHSFLVAMEKPSETLAKNKEVSLPPLQINPEELSAQTSHKYCNHCHKYFDDDNVLIQHLYDLITAKKKAQGIELVSNKPQNPQPTAARSHSVSNKSFYKSCPICSYYYLFDKNMKQHLLVCHNSNQAPGDFVQYNPQCKFCVGTFKNKHKYNEHITHGHNNIWSRKVSETHVQNATYQCPKCPLNFNSLTSAKIHLSQAHSVKKIMTNKSKANEADCVLPKKVLFKCNKCPLHFLVCNNSLAHDRKCMNDKHVAIKSQQCAQCHRFFRRQDMAMHQLQHMHTSVFKVYINHQNLYSCVLYKCPKCSVYFDELIFSKHFKTDCSESNDFGECTVCGINVHNRLVHYRKHTVKKLLKSDFVLINDVVNFRHKSKVDRAARGNHSKQQLVVKSEDLKKNVNKLKRKLQGVPGVYTNKRQKHDSKKTIIYFCNYCKTYMRSKQRQKFHVTKLCNIIGKKTPCVECGLTLCRGIATSYHMSLHRQEKLGLEDFTFRLITNLCSIVPPMPQFPLCFKCNVRYVMKRDHICGESSKECTICRKKFNLLSYKLHIMHHKYIKKDLVEKTSCPDESLKIKYEQLTSTWEVLYNCNACQVVTDSYDRVVDHCQKHYNNMENYDVTITACNICALNFEDKCYGKHSELHSNRDINKNSFKILNYDYTNLLTDQWLGLFNSLPKAQSDQILGRSIYVTRLVRMELVVNGPPEYTLYLCDICRNIVPIRGIVDHTISYDQCAASKQKFECIECGISFGSFTDRNEHAIIHVSENIKEDSYRIVSFNSLVDRELNLKLRKESKISLQVTDVKPALKPYARVKTTKPIKGPSLKVSKISKTCHKKNTYTYYQCQKCFCCRRYSHYRHVCMYEKYAKECIKCKYLFCARSLYKHYAEHNRYKNLTRANIVIVPFNNDALKATSSARKDEKVTGSPKTVKSKDVSLLNSPKKVKSKHNTNKIKETNSASKSDKGKDRNPSKIFKCECGLHFPSKRTIVKHCMECSPDLDVSCENCSKCGLSFPTSLLVNHLINHHSNGDSKLVVYDVPTLYRCTTCKCLFLKKYSLNNHLRSCDGKVYGEKCPECDLLFHRTALVSHVATHSKKKQPKVTYYKCATCDIHFVTREAGLDHIHNKHKQESLASCKVCGLKFQAKYPEVLAKHSQFQCGPGIVTVKKLTEEKLKPNKAAGKKAPVNDSNVIEPANDANNDVESTIRSGQSKLPYPNVSQCKRIAPNSYETIVYNDFSLYKCKKCNLHFVTTAAVVKHSYNHQIKRGVETCSHCSRRFTKQSMKIHKLLHHGKPDNLNPTTETTVNDMGSTTNYETIKYNGFMLYKCKRCILHFCTTAAVVKHLYKDQIKGSKTCAIKKGIEICSLCSRRFTNRSIKIHKALHHGEFGTDNPNSTTDNPNPTTDNADLTTDNLNPTTDNANLTTDNPNTTTDNPNPTTNNPDPTTDNPNPMTDNPSPTTGTTVRNGKRSKRNCYETVKYNGFLFYKCKKCNLHFCTTAAVTKHLYNNHEMKVVRMCPRIKRGIKVCSLCSKRFTNRSMKIHKALHHGKCGTDNPTTATVEDSAKVIAEQPASRQKSYDFKLYKCGECNVHFLTQSSCYKHILNHEPLYSAEYIACKICNLQFKISTLIGHVKQHHANNFDLDKVLVEEYGAVNSGLPKIEIYYAGDKVQSKLVSTTTVESDELLNGNQKERDPSKDPSPDRSIGDSNATCDYTTNVEAETS